MQKVLHIDQVEEYSMFMDAQVVNYIAGGQTQTYESLKKFDLLAFDWYPLEHETQQPSKILIYMDRDDLFFLCEDERAWHKVNELLVEDRSNEEALYLFFDGLLKNDTAYLDELEGEITDTEDAVLTGKRRDFMGRIVAWRKQLLSLKRYYEQLTLVLENLSQNNDGFLTEQGERRFTVLCSRSQRFGTGVQNLRDYVTQLREACQTQIDLEQNELMKFFTVITAVFLPLSLLVGWYGMNFAYMPELRWRFGYLGVIGLSIVICLVLILWFRKKKWF